MIKTKHINTKYSAIFIIYRKRLNKRKSKEILVSIFQEVILSVSQDSKFYLKVRASWSLRAEATQYQAEHS